MSRSEHAGSCNRSPMRRCPTPLPVVPISRSRWSIQRCEAKAVRHREDPRQSSEGSKHASRREADSWRARCRASDLPRPARRRQRSPVHLPTRGAASHVLAPRAKTTGVALASPSHSPIPAPAPARRRAQLEAFRSTAELRPCSPQRGKVASRHRRHSRRNEMACTRSAPRRRRSPSPVFEAQLSRYGCDRRMKSTGALRHGRLRPARLDNAVSSVP
jgi:hypothetical protein